ncbi:ricin-type beta-trefoil lectin domain protein [Allokutzneria oryzae]|uniref:Ricin-type beta-trefoil lectin domain protein n=1 Tax=Allokutzneria oryzae TaxID=1378989 RepID=A0ABV5ZTL5_9PSEU
MAVVTTAFLLGAAVVAIPAHAAGPPGTGHPVASARPGEAAPRDAKGRALLYLDGAQDTALRRAVTDAGGEVTSGRDGRVQAAVPQHRVAALAADPAVRDVRRPERAIPMAITSEGVAASGADAWIRDGKKGAGVRIGIIDVGFQGLGDAQSAGELPATGTRLAVNNTNCRDATKFEDHGTAVAEVVHDMAPDADLYLACIDGPLDFAPAAEWLQQQGVHVTTAAVGFLTSGRGDGTGEPNSPAEVVKRTREAGMLWSIAAGNLAVNHFAGKAVDANGDGYVEFSGATQNNGFNLAAGRSATVGLRWDAWPRTNDDLDVYVMKGNHKPTGPTDPDIKASSVNNQRDVAGGARPTEELTFTNDDGAAKQYWVYVKNNNAPFTRPFELFVHGPSDPLQFATPDGSITEPATSAYAMAVGGTQPHSGVVAPYSGRGPTVDGRTKPDITGFTGVSTSTYGTSALVGTSAAAAHVAGAAAVLKSANPQLDASQLQAALLSRTNPKRSDNLWGNGTLALGTPDTVPVVTGHGYTSLPEPKRTSNIALAPNQIFTVPMPDVPADTSAVTITLTGRTDPGVGPDIDSRVDVFPGDPTTSGSKATGLQVRKGGTFTSTTFVATLGKDRAIRLRGGPGHTWVGVELLGYFSATGASTYFARPTAGRVLDTRAWTGASGTQALKAQTDRAVQIRGVADVPQNATAVAVNITAVEATGESWLGAYTQNRTGTGTVSPSLPTDRRSNLAIVGIAEDGKIRISNHSWAGHAHVIVDVLGWFAPGAGARYVALPEAVRIADTSTGTGLRNTAIGHGETADFQVGGLAGVSRAATAVVLTTTAGEDTQGTEISLRPTDLGWSGVTDFGLNKLETAANTGLVPLGVSGKVGVRNERGQARVALDVAGYFVGGRPAPTGTGSCPASKGEKGFLSAFDGRAETSLDAWLTAGMTPLVSQNCELITQSGNDVTWYAAHTFGGDYTVKLDWKSTSEAAQSGVLVMFPHPGADPAVPAARGLEAQIGPAGATGTAATGAITPGRGPDAAAAKPVGQWNTYEITVAWNTVTVVLNGQKVNQFTTTDPARLNAHSFIGLQNHGASAPVHFRDVRIKRNTPVRSGALVGLNNACLDVPGGDPNQGKVQMWGCYTSPHQVWTSIGDGTISNTGKCLATSGAAQGAPVGLAACHVTPEQQWVQRPDGSLINPVSTRCLTAVSSADGGALQIQDCGTRADQVWRFSEDRGRSGMLATTTGQCLDVADNDSRKLSVAVWSCNGTMAQVWALAGDATVRNGSRCLDITGGATAAGTAVALATCTAGSGQKWELRQDGAVVNPASGLCLTSASLANGAKFTVQNCGSGANQSWRLTAPTLWRGSIVGWIGKCADVKNGTPTSGVVWLWSCHGGDAQVWSYVGTGSIWAQSNCLDVAGGDNGNGMIIGACQAKPTQSWVHRPNGTLVSIPSGRCMDNQGGNQAEGAFLQLYDCVGWPAERWATPVLAS